MKPLSTPYLIALCLGLLLVLLAAVANADCSDERYVIPRQVDWIRTRDGRGFWREVVPRYFILKPLCEDEDGDEVFEMVPVTYSEWCETCWGIEGG